MESQRLSEQFIQNFFLWTMDCMTLQYQYYRVLSVFFYFTFVCNGQCDGLIVFRQRRGRSHYVAVYGLMSVLFRFYLAFWLAFYLNFKLNVYNVFIF